MSRSWNGNGNSRARQSPIVVGLGEALFDLIAGQSILGGAPLNLATHAHAMLSEIGGCATVASRVGRDDLGDRVMAELQTLGMEVCYVQRDPETPTGTVEVHVSDGSPTYTIRENVAWDCLDFTSEWKTLAATCDAVSFGTLAQRNVRAQETIHCFLQSTRNDCLRVFDVNLRQCYFDAAMLKSSLQMANVLKLNQEELQTIARLLRLDGEETDGWLDALRETFELQVIALTRGAEGTRILGMAGQAEGCVAADVSELQADSVGAGDASCAGLIVGMLSGWSLDDTLQLANVAGAYVASQQGATPSLPVSLREWIRDTQTKYSVPDTRIA